MSAKITVENVRDLDRMSFKDESIAALAAACYREVAHRMQTDGTDPASTKRLALFAHALEDFVGESELIDDIGPIRAMVHRIYFHGQGAGDGPQLG